MWDPVQMRVLGCYATPQYSTMEHSRCYDLYRTAPPLKPEHAVIRISQKLLLGKKLVVKIPIACISGVGDTTLPKAYDAPGKVVIIDPPKTKKEKPERFMSQDIVTLYTFLLQGDDLERELPRFSSQVISCQALTEGFRVMQTEENDVFYGQTNPESPSYMVPSTHLTKQRLLELLNLPPKTTEIEILRFSTWQDIREYCCGAP